LSRLAVWWIKLGIVPERIDAGHPEQNGRHERMHRTMKEAVAMPPAEDWRAQQRFLDRSPAVQGDRLPMPIQAEVQKNTVREADHASLVRVALSGCNFVTATLVPIQVKILWRRCVLCRKETNEYQHLPRSPRLDAFSW
jgi:hypothetical protein